MSDHERASTAIRWIERSSFLHEARVAASGGADLYAGYVAATPGADAWRGYVGREFVPLGLGPRMVMQAAVEQRVRDILAQREDSYHAS
jgi:hypothetical protein